MGLRWRYRHLPLLGVLHTEHQADVEGGHNVAALEVRLVVVPNSSR